jgi:hypothetical protein
MGCADTCQGQQTTSASQGEAGEGLARMMNRSHNIDSRTCRSGRNADVAWLVEEVELLPVAL